MKISSTFTLLLSVASVATALPKGKKHHAKHSFKIHRVEGNKYVRSHSNAITKSYQKWGMALPEEFLQNTLSVGDTNVDATSNITAPGQVGSVQNTPTQYDVEFLSPVTIGGQTLMMDFDTGSSDLWVFSSALPAQEQAGHTIYDPAKSSTFQQLPGQTFAISYGDQSGASGNIVGTDTVNIGGATATSCAVELATSVSASFVNDTASNGLVGLAFSKLNTVKPNQQKTFFDTIAPTLKEPVFTANLQHGRPGTYEFGNIDGAQFSGTMQFSLVDATSGFWAFPNSKFRVGDGQLMLNTANSPAIADTGTSLMLLDQDVVDFYYQQVQGAKFDPLNAGFMFPCSSVLPDLHLELGTQGYTATIPGSGLNFVEVAGGQCFGALQSNQGQAVQILGDVFFKAQFVAFDIGQNMIGFANHAAAPPGNGNLTARHVSPSWL